VPWRWRVTVPWKANELLGVQGRPRADTAYTPIKNDTESEHIISFIFSPLPSFCFQENSLAVKLESEEADGDSAKKKIEEDYISLSSHRLIHKFCL
jgi:hypothetical protein